MERFKVNLLSEKVISMYNYDVIKIKVKDYFEKYRECLVKKRLMAFSISDPLGNDNMGIFSSEISDTVQSKVVQMEKLNKYIERINYRLDLLKKELTEEEKVILQKSILEDLSDEEVVEILNIAIRGLYPRKKSCYIKTSIFFNLDVFKKWVKYFLALFLYKYGGGLHDWLNIC